MGEKENKKKRFSEANGKKKRNPKKRFKANTKKGRRK